MKQINANMKVAKQRGQGAQLNPANRFFTQQNEGYEDYLNYLTAEAEEQQVKTKVIEVFPKTVVNPVASPDVGMKWSLNPYQGCEHGCTYCYARNSHEYWGYSAGVDFERVILVKKSAPALLEATLKQRSWSGEPIVLSGNTDCYQPIERKLQLTRKLLEVFKRYDHPVGIITKNALVIRDLDILAPMAEKNLVSVAISITSLDDDLRKNMEPRTASIAKRLEAVKVLSEAGIPVTVMFAPIIPGLNSHEVFDVLKAAKEAGAHNVNFTMVRLNGQIADIFSDWIHKCYPNKAEHVLNLIRSTHQGKLNDSNFGQRMRGSGNIAKQITDSFALAKLKYFGMPDRVKLSSELYLQKRQPQLTLF